MAECVNIPVADATSEVSTAPSVQMTLKPSDIANLAEMLKSLMLGELKQVVNEVVSGVADALKGSGARPEGRNTAPSE